MIMMVSQRLLYVHKEIKEQIMCNCKKLARTWLVFIGSGETASVVV